jgi:hypothetical protein
VSIAENEGPVDSVLHRTNTKSKPEPCKIAKRLCLWYKLLLSLLLR